MSKGEVWIVEIPGLDGHEQRGCRPAILMADTRMNVALIVPCTSNLEALRFPYTLHLNTSRKNGPSVALVLQLRAIDKKRLTKKVGTLEKSLLNEIDRMLHSLLAL